MLIKVQEHLQLIEETKTRINKTKNKTTQKQLIKYLHRLYKELNICYRYTKE